MIDGVKVEDLRVIPDDLAFVRNLARVRAGELRGTTFGGSTMVTMIDELPVLAVAATQVAGFRAALGAVDLAPIAPPPMVWPFRAATTGLGNPVSVSRSWCSRCKNSAGACGSRAASATR